MKQPPAVTASGWMISPESFCAKRLWMVLEDPHKVLGFRQNVAGDALAPGSQLSAPKKISAATAVGLPKNGGRPKNGYQTMGKTMINQESLIFVVPKSATKPSWATWPKYLKLPDPGPALFEHQLLAVVRNNPNALVETSFEASHLLRNVRPC